MKNDIEQVAMRAARAAGKIHLKRLSRITVNRKSSSIDLVTEADREAEAAVIEIIHRSFPTHAILAEESGASTHRSDHRWIVDPLDGTTNFAHGYPQFCVSIAYELRGRVQFGVVFDALKKECFVAQRGKGAQLNGKPIRVSTTPSLGASLLCTGFPYDRRERRRFYLSFWEEFMTRVQGVRRTGSAALDLVYVAAGRIDGFWEFGLKAWDVAAGALIVEEARGRVSNMDSSALDLNGANILATNGRVHNEMVEVIAGVRPEAERRHAEMLRTEKASA
ncbi:MAG: inositol monophosphatase family protein [Candidatus Binatus sp.]|uniref:inositol monophosphatase family protein n=1 Tax=Candidatus Binatus sp. TaxID=2811406 RepID=UPI002719C2C8|nr:inositol monophosphatase family protein [Candidatus Binatus sp.]MDO8434251.1 inositol monophosphatase family protein [Candidatus Binatus sp.]